MAFIQVHQSLRDHHKILELSALLDMPEAHVAGHCVYLWLWSLDNAPDGLLPKAERAVERSAGWVGTPGVFIEGMVSVGMLGRDTDGRLYIHDWADYTGKLMESRKANAERQARWRERRNGGDDATGNDSVTPSNADVTVTSPLRNALEKTREEKSNVEQQISSPRNIVRTDATLVLAAADAASEDGSWDVSGVDVLPVHSNGHSHDIPNAGSLAIVSTPSEKTAPMRRAPPVIPLESEAARVASALRDAILKSKPDAKDARRALKPAQLQNWARPIDCMMRIDERSVERMLAVIGWLPTNDFWRRNILSPSKFREKFDTLEMLYRSERIGSNEGGGSNGNGRYKPGAAAANGSGRTPPRGAREVVTDQEVWRQRAAAHRSSINPNS